MVLVAPAGSPEAGRRTVSIDDAAHLPMIGTRNPGCRQIIDDAFRQAAVLPTYVFRSDDNPTIQGLIGSGLAYAVLPLLTVDENDPNGRHPHPTRASATPARDRMASRAQTVSGPSGLCRGGGGNLSRPRRAVGRATCCVSRRTSGLVKPTESRSCPGLTPGRRFHLPGGWIEVEIPQPGPGAPRSSRDDLSCDADGGFLGCSCSQIEANRTRQPGQLGVRQAGGAQALQTIEVGLQPIAPTYPSRGSRKARQRTGTSNPLGRG